MEAQLSLAVDSDPAPTYAQRGTNVLQTIFKEHFREFAEDYEQKYAPTYGRFRLERITDGLSPARRCGIVGRALMNLDGRCHEVEVVDG